MLFKGKATFTFLSFDNYFRLFGSIFSKITSSFYMSELNDKTFFYTRKYEFNLKGDVNFYRNNV